MFPLTVGLTDFYRNIECIDENAFAFCYNLEKVYIPSSVTEIGISVFCKIENQITIYGERWSYAESYAMKTGIAFIEEKENDDK